METKLAQTSSTRFVSFIYHRFIANLTVRNAISIILNSVWSQNQGPMGQAAPQALVRQRRIINRRDSCRPSYLPHSTTLTMFATETEGHITRIYEGSTESYEQLFFACKLGTADEGECGDRWNQLLCYP